MWISSHFEIDSFHIEISPIKICSGIKFTNYTLNNCKITLQIYEFPVSDRNKELYVTLPSCTLTTSLTTIRWHEWQILLQLCYPKLIQNQFFLMNLTFIPRREFLCLLLDGIITLKAGSNLCSSLLHKIIRQSPCFHIYTDPVVCDSTTMTGTDLEVLARFFHDFFCILVMIKRWRLQLWRLFTSTQPPGNASLLKLC